MAASNNTQVAIKSSEALASAKDLNEITNAMSGSPAVFAIMGNISLSFAGKVTDFSLITEDMKEDDFKSLK